MYWFLNVVIVICKKLLIGWVLLVCLVVGCKGIDIIEFIFGCVGVFELVVCVVQYCYRYLMMVNVG